MGALLWLILDCAYVSDSAQDSTRLSLLCRDSLIFDTSVTTIVAAVSLRCLLCLREAQGARNPEPDVDIRVCGTESEVEDPRRHCVHILEGERHVKTRKGVFLKARLWP